jgi:hypothetical protein
MRKFTACSTSPKYLSKRRAYLFLLVFASRDQTSASVRRLLPSSVKSMQSFSALQKIHVCRVSNLVSLTLPITRRRSPLYHNRTTFVGRRAWALLDRCFVAHLFFQCVPFNLPRLKKLIIVVDVFNNRSSPSASPNTPMRFLNKGLRISDKSMKLKCVAECNKDLCTLA